MAISVKQITPQELRTEEQIIASWGDTSKKTLVSVSCITYNHERYIGDAIIGFLRQKTTFPIEILIHDDASTDNTSQIIEGFRKKYPNLIKPIIQKENQFSKGIIPQSFNVKRALGTYFAMCEGDDYWISDSHLQDAVQHFTNNQGMSIYGAGSFILRGNIVKQSIPKADCFNLDRYVGSAPFVATCTLVVKTSIWREILKIPVFGGRYFAGDSRLKLISLTQGDMVINRSSIAVYRKGVGGSWSLRKLDERVITKELLDNIAITREVGKLNNYKNHRALFMKVEREVLIQGLTIAARNGTCSWLSYIISHLQLLSPKLIRRSIILCPLTHKIRAIRIFKLKRKSSNFSS